MLVLEYLLQNTNGGIRMKAENTSPVSENGAEPEAKEKRHTLRIAIAAIIALIANFIFFFMLWMLNRYDEVLFDQILYQIKSPK